MNHCAQIWHDVVCNYGCYVRNLMPTQNQWLVLIFLTAFSFQSKSRLADQSGTQLSS